MLKITILLCAAFVVAAENIVDVSPDIKRLQQKFNVAKEHYEHLDENNLLKSIKALMKKVYADADSIDRNSKAYIDNNCHLFVDQVFDNVNNILSSTSQCNVDNLKPRYVHIWSMFDRLKSDVVDVNSIGRDPRPLCGDETCEAVYNADRDSINNMYNDVLPAKVSAIEDLLNRFANSIDYCQISTFSDLQQEASTFLAKTKQCMAGEPK